MPKKDKRSTNEQSLILYQAQVLIPSSWINQADLLIEVSKKLEPNIKKYWLTTSKYFDINNGTYTPPPGFKPKRLLQGTYFMLLAYAIENYFKAIMIMEFEATYRGEILRTRIPAHEHDLYKRRAEYDQNGPRIGHDAVCQERPVHGVARPRWRRIHLVLDRRTDGRGRDNAADVHPRTAVLAD